MNRIPIPQGIETRAFIMQSSAIDELPAVLRQEFPHRRPWIVADENTWSAAGARAFEVMEVSGLCPAAPYVFPGKPILHADERYVPELCAAMPEGAVPIAVGGGTINDLVKRASGVCAVSYLCLPTAPSVDGYTSYGAAMLVDGRKRTMPCPAPAALVVDLGVLESAPSAMFASGYADLAAKIPAGADWLLVDALGLEPIVPEIWNLVQRELRRWLCSGDLQGVFMGLAATGYAMQLYRDSRPASGAEHLFSHIWEMEGLTCHGESVSHGFQVCIGSLMSLRLMETLWTWSEADARRLAAPPLTRPERERQVRELLKRGCYGAEAFEVAMEKFLEPSELLLRRERIFSHWDGIGERFREQLLPYDEFKEMLRRVGCPLRYDDIGLSESQFRHAFLAAQLIRKRYTILDLLFEAGLLERVASVVEL